MERQGSGFKKITEAYYAAHNYRAELEPKFYSDVTSFQVTLYNLNYGISEKVVVETEKVELEQEKVAFGAKKVAFERSLSGIKINAPTKEKVLTLFDHFEYERPFSRSDIIQIYRAIRRKKKWMAEEVFDKILNVTDGTAKRKTVEAAKTYITENWTGIMEQIKNKEADIECSAEGHVSHVYADRMSSRPLGWSRVGADKMSRLRIYHYNKGDMLELVRYQKQEIKQAAGAEDIIYNASQMMRMERENKKRLGAMADMPVYTIPYPQIKKIANLKDHIWGL